MEIVVYILPSWFANKTCCSRVLLLLECNTSGLFRGQVSYYRSHKIMSKIFLELELESIFKVTRR